MEIPVTRRDIDEGWQSHPEMCPISLALDQQNINASVYNGYIYLKNYGRKALAFKTDPNVQAWLGVYDDTGASGVTPFTLKLEMTPPAQQAHLQVPDNARDPMLPVFAGYAALRPLAEEDGDGQ